MQQSAGRCSTYGMQSMTQVNEEEHAHAAVRVSRSLDPSGPHFHRDTTMRKTIRIRIATAAAIFAPIALSAQTPMTVTALPSSQSAAPTVGSAAPDFTAQGADQSGSHTVTLSKLRGHVVVLAFYPADRSSGCTHELNKFRDEYSAIFGPDVVVLPISEDSLGSHVSWASDAKFPFTLVSDESGRIAAEYGSMMAGRPYASRTVFVIGKGGRVADENLKFGALDQHAYDWLTSAISKARSE